MLALFILVILLCLGVSQWAAGRYAQVTNEAMKQRAPTAHTGAEIARMFLAYEGIHDVEIVLHGGIASDYFDPKRRRLFLRPEVAEKASLGAWAIALHEAAHATQTEDSLSELKWRQTVIRLARYGPMFGVIGVIGLALLRFPARFGLTALIGLCVLLLLLNIGTLAVEFNANARLRRFLEKHLDRQPDGLDRLNACLGRVALREVGDLLQSPRYFFFSAMPGSGKIRPTK